MKAFSHGWMARVSFAYNDWQQHFGPGAIINPNNETPGNNASGPIVGDGHQRDVAVQRQRHVDLPLGVEAGVNLFGRQGFPRRTGSGLPDGPSTPGPHPDRAGDALSNSEGLRARSAALEDLSDRVGGQVIPQFACFNLLDSRTVLAREGLVGATTRRWSGVRQRPQVQRRGLRLSPAGLSGRRPNHVLARGPSRVPARVPEARVVRIRKFPGIGYGSRARFPPLSVTTPCRLSKGRLP